MTDTRSPEREETLTEQYRRATEEKHERERREGRRGYCPVCGKLVQLREGYAEKVTRKHKLWGEKCSGSWEVPKQERP